MIIDGLIGASVRHRGFVLGGVLTLLAGGIWAWSTIPFEPFPDLTANTVSVITDAPGMAPQDVEQLVTFPIERSLLGLPRTECGPVDHQVRRVDHPGRLRGPRRPLLRAPGRQ